MSAVAEKPREKSEKQSMQSERLQALQEDARDVRKRLVAGDITIDEATNLLADLTRRHSTLLNRIFDL